MKLYMSDLYRVEVHYPLDEVQNDVLYYLYQPIVGSRAISAYMMLYLEGKRMGRFLQPSPLSRIISFLSVSLLDFQKALKALEAIGLLKTYVKQEHQMTQYIYVIQSPLSVQSFFKNQILSSLLEESLTQDDYKKTIQYFKIPLEDLSHYKEVTSSFTDVYTIQHTHKNKKILKMNESFKEKTSQLIDISYDMDLLLKSLKDYQVSKSSLTKQDFTYISQLGSVYSIDALSMAGMIKDSLKSSGLDRKLLKTKVKQYCDIHSSSSLNEVYHKQPIQLQTQSVQQDPIVLHMKYLDSITPYELLKEKQGGSEPVFHDLMIVETLMVQLGLKPAVVNVLIEYVLGKNNNRLSKRYCEAIGSSWARKHIETSMDAYHELMNQDEETIDTNTKQETVDSRMELDEIEQLLSELKEGNI